MKISEPIKILRAASGVKEADVVFDHQVEFYMSVYPENIFYGRFVVEIINL